MFWKPKRIVRELGNCFGGRFTANLKRGTEVYQRRLESSLDSKEIKPVNPKGNQSWIFIGKTDAEAEAPILCHLMQRVDSLEDSDVGKIKSKEKRIAEDEMVRQLY